MNGNILDGQMDLEEKLKLIAEMMENAEVENQRKNPGAAPLDPADLTMCEGCQ